VVFGSVVMGWNQPSRKMGKQQASQQALCRLTVTLWSCCATALCALACQRALACQHAVCSAQVDIWAVGVLAYELMSGGATPFYHDEPETTQRLILKVRRLDGSAAQP
jgi:hypothetical protein